MEIKELRENDKLTIFVIGSLDSMTSEDLDEYIRENIENVKDLILDFKDLDYVSSAGLRVLLVTLKLMKSRGEFKIINVNENVNEVLAMTGFANLIKIERA